MIVLDTTVLVYATGAEHPLRAPCRRVVTAVGDGRLAATTTAEAIVLATREQIWELLRDADEVARLTPFVTRIEDRGEHWIWSMTRLPVPKATLSPTFTEKMEFVELERIEFKHDAPEGSDENACVDGWYELEELEPESLLFDFLVAVRLELLESSPESSELELLSSAAAAASACSSRARRARRSSRTNTAA